MMKLQLFDSARLFLERTGSYLERNEAGNNLLLGLTHVLIQQETRGDKTAKPFMAAVEERDGSPVLVMLMTPVNMIVAGEGPQPELEQAVRLAAAHLIEQGAELPGVVGPPEIAGQLAFAWASAKRATPYVKMNQRVYRLDEVNAVPLSAGGIRLAGTDDLELVADWIHEFAESVGENMSREDAAQKARENIVGASLYLWEDGRPVSMAKKTRPTRNGIVLSLVYTPILHRNKGYASSCVASLSRLLLDEGYRFCSLYTDLSNPTSNSIYAKIGYNPVQDSILYRFK
ncbi:GNAT family N-acetyltransferase [Paenibacillus mesophilus]|uniref:GNAT family N-acetyltransferase n=1 Tax=Paenibacillus mesophilus TaxID=2582849 RepID=UPI00110E2C29|nr:GNAT family N-acetyltransferase [Paenibacillus mesophilus]TMV44694.1 GNAT family N-acetyltransferase [Paenibacillus mesophilus]